MERAGCVDLAPFTFSPTLKPGSKEQFFLIACIYTQVLALCEFESHPIVLHGREDT